MKNRYCFHHLYLITCLLALGGCSSIAKGVTEAVMDHKTEDTRICEIMGPPFTGIKNSLHQQSQGGGSHHTKVLMVHGIGKHLPDYSARFREKLTKELKLDKIDSTVKEIDLLEAEEKPNASARSAGLLKIFRYESSQNSSGLLFYELTWSGITDEDKQVIAFDDSEAYSYRRASINKTLKHFMNSTVPDVLAYQGLSQPLINKAVGQSVCWMFEAEWDDLPQGRHYCAVKDQHVVENIKRDDYFVVTHSLGSRITIDTFNNFGAAGENEKLKPLHEALKNEELTVFMLANQLPFLQVGRAKPKNAELIVSLEARATKTA
jgi:hypothetical protein